MMQNDRLFPQDVLQKPIQDRVSYFEKDVRVAHPRLVEAHRTLLEAIRQPGESSIITVIGPSGVGKTTLKDRVIQEICRDLLEALQSDPGRLPVISVDAVAYESGNFNWKDYYIRSLAALAEPLIDRKSDKRVAVSPNREDGVTSVRARATSELRRALEAALKHRRPAAFIIDEAQHFAKMSSGRRLQDQLDCIKSLAQTTHTLQVLLGTYELVPFRNLSGQLSRRNRTIHFRRYDAMQAHEAGEFQDVVFTLEKHLPLPQESNLLGHWEYLYERSIGCVGILKNWLTRALSRALDLGAKKMAFEHLRHSAFTIAECEKMALDAIEGEKRLGEGEGTNSKLLMLLGLPPRATTPPLSNAPQDEESAPPALSKRPRPGQRNPKRDRVGLKGVDENAG